MGDWENISRADVKVFFHALSAGFASYFCVYGLKVPVFAASWDDEEFFGVVELKATFAFAQVAGYGLAKIPSLRYGPMVGPRQRFSVIGGLLLLAAMVMLLFPFVNNELKVLCIFLNGFFLSPVWGIYLMYYEGRRLTEPLVSGVSMSFIISAGVFRSIGAALLDAGVSENWMPAVMGVTSVIPAIAFLFLLNRVDPPSVADIAQRTVRQPVSSAQRSKFLSSFGPGVFPIVFLYALFTAFKLFRDVYLVELWEELLEKDDVNAGTYAAIETPIGFLTLLVLGLLYRIKDNNRAFMCLLLTMCVGGLFIGFSALLYQADFMEPTSFMLFVGLGLFLSYIPPGAILFDRLIAVTQQPYTSTFLVYICDGAGYVGTTILLAFQSFVYETDDDDDESDDDDNDYSSKPFLTLFLVQCGLTSVCTVVIMAWSYYYFSHVFRNKNAYLSVSISDDECGDDDVDGSAIPPLHRKLRDTEEGCDVAKLRGDSHSHSQ
eukprot:Rmarinus@m.28181